MEAWVAALPAYVRTDRSLHLLDATGPSIDALSQEDCKLFDAIRDAALRSPLASSDATLRRWSTLGVCITFTPPTRSHTAKRLLVIEPHMDDAVLSVGGRLWQRRHDTDIHLLTVFPRSVHTFQWETKATPASFDAQAITELRLAESRLAARLLGATHHALPYDTVVLRNQAQWSAARYREHRRSLTDWHMRAPDEALTTAIAEAVAAKVAALAPNEIWCPLGIGEHADHQLLRIVCARLFAQQRSASVAFYEDVPYVMWLSEHHGSAIREDLQASGLTLLSEDANIEEALQDKLRLIAIHRSQFAIEDWRPAIVDSARRGQAHATERLFRVGGEAKGTSFTCPAAFIRQSVHASDYARVSRDARRFVKAAAITKRIDVLSWSPPSAELTHTLARMAPHAQIVTTTRGATRQLLAGFLRSSPLIICLPSVFWPSLRRFNKRRYRPIFILQRVLLTLVIRWRPRLVTRFPNEALNALAATKHESFHS